MLPGWNRPVFCAPAGHDGLAPVGCFRGKANIAAGSPGDSCLLAVENALANRGTKWAG